MKKAFLIGIGFLLTSAVGFASVLKGSFILSKLAENSGGGYYQIEQEVTFMTEGEPLVLKESWLIENENSMRLNVSAPKNSKDSVSISVVYSGGAKNSGAASRLTEEMFERYFHIRNPDNMASALIQMKIAPPSLASKKALRSLKDAEFQNESFVRLARLGGVVNFAFGNPTPADSGSLLPGLWVEQDQFLIRKLRLPSQAEIQAEKYNVYARGLNFPRQRSLRWADKQVQLQTLSVSPRTKEQFNSWGQKPQFRTDGILNPQLRTIVDEFYSRFR